MKDELRVGIVGSRRRSTLKDRRIVFDLVKTLKEQHVHRHLVVVSGACKTGADSFAAAAAKIYEVELKEFPVPSKRYTHRGEFVKEAFARNLLIAQDSHVGFALCHPDRTGGTENTVGHYRDLGKTVYLVDEEGRTYLSSYDEENKVDVPRDPDRARASQRT